MPLRSGTMTLQELEAVTDQTIQAFGEDRVLDALQADLDFHNESVREQMEELATPTTERHDRYGLPDETEMEEANELTRPRTQIVRGHQTVSYPLRKYVRGVGWTRDFLERATPRDLARQQIAVQASHVKKLGQEIAFALFNPVNYTTWDEHVDQIELHIKALLNGDGAAVPRGPFGEEFDGDTHTHYLAIDWAAATEAQREAFIENAIADLVEHGHGDDVVLNISQRDEGRISDLPSFLEYRDRRVRPGIQDDYADGVLDTTRMNNRAFGLYRSAETWTKPWVPQDYGVLYARGDEAKPLKYREDKLPGRRGLRLGGQIPAYPLLTDNFEAWFGFGAYTRSAAVIIYLGGPVYQIPNLGRRSPIMS